ncbi:MAG: hypothetical protein AAF264_10705, partial [Pseudomonadota bacterium]
TLSRKTHKAFNRVREGNFSLERLTGFDLNAKTVGVIGTGALGATSSRHWFVQAPPIPMRLPPSSTGSTSPSPSCRVPAPKAPPFTLSPTVPSARSLGKEHEVPAILGGVLMLSLMP